MSYAPLTVNVARWLIEQLAAAIPSAHVDGKTPPDLQSELPFIRVERTGGPSDGHILDSANVALHCFAGNQNDADDLGYTALRAVLDMRAVAADGAILNRARTLSGPSWAAVEDQNIAHAVVLMQIWIKTTGQ